MAVVPDTGYSSSLFEMYPMISEITVMVVSEKAIQPNTVADICP